MTIITVTGVTGFVGKNLKAYLQDAYKIKGVSRNKSKENRTYEELEKQGLGRTFAFIHLAGKAHDLKKTSNPEEYFEINTELTKRVFNQFLKSDSEVFIYMSSVKACADKVEGMLTESTQENPKTIYGKSKLLAEAYILSKEIPSNKRVYILRPCMIHGPNNKGNLNILYNLVSKGIPYPLGIYSNRRSFVSIQNLCFVIKELLKNRNIPNGVYNVSDDESLSTNNLVKHIANAIGKKETILKLPKSLVKVIASIGNILPLPLNSERLQKLTENYEVSNYKIKTAIEKELPMSTQEGIAYTIKSFM